MPQINIIVVAFGNPQLLDQALEPIQAGSSGDAAVVVVDNSSSKIVAEVARRHSATYIDSGSNIGFARAVNLGIAHAADRSDVLLLNPDARVDWPTVVEMQRRLHSSSNLACVAPAQMDLEGASQRVEWPLPSPLRAWLEVVRLGNRLSGYSFLIGSILLIRHEALQDVGTFDERFFLYAEEVDWQRRALLRGWTSLFCEDLTATHLGGATSSDRRLRELLFASAHELYFRKWHGTPGWQSFRAAQIVGSLGRSVFGTESGRRAALRRALTYALGPSRTIRRRKLLSQHA